MIVFYTAKKSIFSIENASVCNSVCTSNCIKPKNKCCNKYKKKGVNCKRCPKVLLETAS